jgi:hypothetical protein
MVLLFDSVTLYSVLSDLWRMSEVDIVSPPPPGGGRRASLIEVCAFGDSHPCESDPVDPPGCLSFFVVDFSFNQFCDATMV